jgi:hypothetical protein
MANPFAKLVNPWYPANALGLERDVAAAVRLERSRGVYSLGRAAVLPLPEALIAPGFDEPNVSNPHELAVALTELVTSAGLMRQRRWSVALPELAGRTLILTLESHPGSAAELEEFLAWKLERSFGAPVEELTLSRDALPSDPSGKERYLVCAIRTAVLQEYENVFAMLKWRVGLILPRQVGESRWLVGSNFRGDSLLISPCGEGFTAVILRDGRPLIIRAIACSADERDDELYRLLLFYRDRHAPETEGVPAGRLARLLILGQGFVKDQISTIVNDTLGGNLRSLGAADVGLQLPSREISFDTIAAPAGLATLAYS